MTINSKDAPDVEPCFRAERRGEIIRCVEEAIRKSRDGQRAEADLSAQQAMARWARWLLIVTAIQLPIGLGGVIGVLYTVRQNRRGLEQAKAATDRQLSAYVLPAKIALERGDFWKVTFVARNTGLTPAERVRACAVTHYVDFPASEKEWPSPHAWEEFSHVPAGSPVRITVSLDVPEAQRLKIENHTAGLLCFMWIQYQPLPDAEWTLVRLERIFLAEDLLDGTPRVIPEWIRDGQPAPDQNLPESEAAAPMSDEA